MSLRSRALMAVALTVGFYALALGLIAGLIAVLFIPNIPGRLFGFCLIGAAVIAISIVPWPRRFVAPGPMLNPAGQPRLFAELQGVAKAVGGDALDLVVRDDALVQRAEANRVHLLLAEAVAQQRHA